MIALVIIQDAIEIAVLAVFIAAIGILVGY